MAFCSVVAVVVLESQVARCVHCEEDVAVKQLITNKSLFAASSWSRLLFVYIILIISTGVNYVEFRNLLLRACLTLGGTCERHGG